jgi:hypothetical protein
MTVTGTVMSVRSESDGDTHFDLLVDSQFQNLLRPANFSFQHGWLVGEIVPADKPGCIVGQPPIPPSGSYNYGTCTGADETIPAIGSHVSITGPYVLDEDHGGWAEIHPVWGWSQTGISSGGVSAPTPITTNPVQQTAGVQIISFTSPVIRGSYADLIAQSAPNTSCNLTVKLPSGYQSQSEGLGAGQSDSSGKVQWSWMTGSNTDPGIAQATVTCGSSMATAQIDIQA